MDESMLLIILSILTLGIKINIIMRWNIYIYKIDMKRYQVGGQLNQQDIKKKFIDHQASNISLFKYYMLIYLFFINYAYF